MNTTTREGDFPLWYQETVKKADLAENSDVRGCMVIKPWGYAIWERIERYLDARIKETGHENVYFPLFIPLSYFQKEAEHVEGFAKECAVVTHHRLELKDGKLIPASPLEEPLIVRPTSETIIGESFSRWIESWRDLPLLINQWANVVRWEMRPRIFLRTTEFLWQEGHTAHATSQEAEEEAKKMMGVYAEMVRNFLSLAPILGEKSAGERFPGAVSTLTIEMMMQDRKALQGGTSHYLGQNFAKSSNIRFTNKQGELEYVYTTSWGITTRLIGALVMAHGDDDGIRLPSQVAPLQAVIIPVIPKETMRDEVLAYAEKLQARLQKIAYKGEPLRSKVDKRDIRGGDKSWEWIKKGVPLRIEIGPKEIEKGGFVLMQRHLPHKEKQFFSLDTGIAHIPEALEKLDQTLFEEAETFRKQNTVTHIENFDQLKAFFSPKNEEKPEIHGGFALCKWSEDPESEKILDELKVSIRCLPFEQSGKAGKCVLTGKPAVKDAIFAKSY